MPGILYQVLGHGEGLFLPVYNTMLVEQQFTKAQEMRTMACIPKQDVPTELQGYSPVTLFNTGYKILARITARRLYDLRHADCCIPDNAIVHRDVLTLRRLMSYIYIYIYIYIYMEHPFLMFLDHTQRRTTVGRTPLDE